MAHYGNGNGNGSSLSDLEREAETTRAELAQTVDELQNRVSPQALKRDAKDYARQTSEQFLQTLETRARENPLAAVAVAAGLAFPLWRMAVNMPAPVLLIGAGLAMARRGSSGSSGTTSQSATSLGETAANMIEDTQYKASMLGSRVTGAVSDTAASARQMAGDTLTAVSDAGSQIKQRAVDGFSRSYETVDQSINRYPLLAGGLAFAIGGLIAASLPVTRSENRVMGGASDALRDRAKNMADEGVAAVQSAAGEVYDEVSRSVEEKGLTPDAARGAARSAMTQAGAVISQTASSGESSDKKSLGKSSARKSHNQNLEIDNG